MPVALYAMTTGAFGIGVTESVIMSLLLEVCCALPASPPRACRRPIKPADGIGGGTGSSLIGIRS